MFVLMFLQHSLMNIKGECSFKILSNMKIHLLPLDVGSSSEQLVSLVEMSSQSDCFPKYEEKQEE